MGLPEGAPEVLAQPTRARLFSLLGELKRSAGTSDLADLLGLHPNAYRDLVRWLAQAIKPRPARLREVESAGREIGRSLASRGRAR